MSLIGWIKGLHKNGGTEGLLFNTREDTSWFYNGGTSTVTRNAIDSMGNVGYAFVSGVFESWAVHVTLNTLTGNSDYGHSGGNGDGDSVYGTVNSGVTGNFVFKPTVEESFNKGSSPRSFWNRGGTGTYTSVGTITLRYN